MGLIPYRFANWGNLSNTFGSEPTRLLPWRSLCEVWLRKVNQESKIRQTFLCLSYILVTAPCRHVTPYQPSQQLVILPLDHPVETTQDLPFNPLYSCLSAVHVASLTLTFGGSVDWLFTTGILSWSDKEGFDEISLSSPLSAWTISPTGVDWGCIDLSDGVDESDDVDWSVFCKVAPGSGTLDASSSVVSDELLLLDSWLVFLVETNWSLSS